MSLESSFYVIKPLIEADDLMHRPEERSVITYAAALFHAFNSTYFMAGVVVENRSLTIISLRYDHLFMTSALH